MATESLVNICLGNCLLPDGTKPLSELISTYHSPQSDFNLKTQDIGTQVVLKFTHWKSQPRLVGANGLITVFMCITQELNNIFL